MARKVDRRILKTQKALRKSLYELILEKGYDDISIQDITDHANLGRATFYLHYREKDDLFEDVLREVSDAFFLTLTNEEIQQNPYLNENALKRMFDYSEEFYGFFRIMIMSKGGVVGIRFLMQIMREQISKTFLELDERNIENLYTRALVENYVTGSMFMVVFWWLENEMPIPSEDMARMLLKSNQASMAVVEKELRKMSGSLPVLEGMSQLIEKAEQEKLVKTKDAS